VYLLPRYFFGWKWSNLQLSRNKILVAVAVLVLVPLLYVQANPKAFALLWSKMSADYLIFCSFNLLLIGITEEFAYREIGFKGFLSCIPSRFSVPVSITLSASLFSLAHISRAYLVYSDNVAIVSYLYSVFVVGVFLAYIYHHTRNFALIMVLHILVDINYIIIRPLETVFSYSSFYYKGVILFIILVIITSKIKRRHWKIICRSLILSIYVLVYVTQFEDSSIVEYFANGFRKLTLDDTQKVEYYSNGQKKMSVDSDSMMVLYDYKGRIRAFGKVMDGKRVENWFVYDTLGHIIWQGEYPDSVKPIPRYFSFDSPGLDMDTVFMN
jgi:membrane protease YdiL (CAAX protease family)